MTLLVRLVPNCICSGCGKHGYVESKTLLCCWCFGHKIETESRRQKLTGTLSARFAYLKEKIQRQLAEFR